MRKPAQAPLTMSPCSTRWPALLLPLRLEVRHIDGDLCIRVFPDQPFVSSHKEALSTEEAAAAEPLRAIVGNSGWNRNEALVEDAQGEWTELARRYGPQRAAWILQSLLEGGGTIVPSDAAAIPTLFLLPERFIFLVYQDGQLVYREPGRDVGGVYALLPEPSVDDREPEDGLFDVSSRWVVDFEDAVQRGLGIRIPLIPVHALTTELRLSEIVVVGLAAGGESVGADAFEQFVRIHRFTDGFEFLRYGTPTNNTQETPSGHSQSEDELLSSFDVEVDPPELSAETAAEDLAQALGLPSGASAFKHIRGAGLALNGPRRLLVDTLWPCTGDYFFSTMLGYRPFATERGMLRQYVRDYVRPGGQFATLRVGNMPYGVLPATRTQVATSHDSSGWKSDAIDHRAEYDGQNWTRFDAAVLRTLRTLLPLWLDRANDTAVVPRAGASADADDELVRILGMAPHSLEYSTRPIVDQTLIGVLFRLFQNTLFGVNSSFEGVAGDSTAVRPDTARDPRHRGPRSAGPVDSSAATAAWGYAWNESVEQRQRLFQELGIARHLRFQPSLLRTFAWGRGIRLGKHLVRVPPPPVAESDVAADTDLPPPDGPDTYLPLFVAGQPLPARSASQTILFDLIRRSLQLEPALPTELRYVWPAVEQLRDQPVTDAELENGLRDIVDALTHRLDAWWTTLATRRLAGMRHADAQRTGLHWGAYGYLQDVSLARHSVGTVERDPGAGYIHAPTLAQASAAAVLRSAFAAHSNDPDGNAYAVNLTSSRVHRALALIDGVQQGQDLSALLGYQFERGLHDAGLDRAIDAFRTAFPISPPEPEDTAEAAQTIGARDVVDGRALATALVESDPKIAAALASLAVADAGDSARDRAEARALIADLGDSNDAVGDLLLYEGIYQAVQGNVDRAGAALDACAGLGRPPEIEAVTTRSPGSNLRHRVCLFLPHRTEPPITGSRAPAEPTLNAWVEEVLGDLSQIGCTARFSPADDGLPEEPLTLAQLIPAISAVDILYMCGTLPAGDGDTEIEARLRRTLRGKRAIASDSVIQLELGTSPPDSVSIAHVMEIGRTLLDLLGNATVVTPPDLTHPDNAPTQPFYTDTACSALIGRATTALGRLEPQSGGLSSADPTTLRAALDVCAEFGISEAVLDQDDDAAIPARARTVAGIVAKRIQAARESTDAAGAASGDARLPHAVAALQALFGESFVVLPACDASGVAEEQRADFDSALPAHPAEDRIWLWLQQVAETHPRVRRLETFLLAAEAWGKITPSLSVAQLPRQSNLEWQALADTEMTSAGRAHGRINGVQSVVALVPADFDVGNVTGLVIDDWTETLPAASVTTGISLEYDQPASQAPQCFLLAVPGNFDEDAWTAEHLAGIVRDTMELARVRLVDLDALPDVGGLAPALMFPIPPAPVIYHLDQPSSVYGVP